MRRRGRQAISVIALTAVVAGIPAALVGLVGWPLPHGWPRPDEVRAALEGGWTPDERFVLGTLALLVWALWAQLLRHLVDQLGAQRRLRLANASAEPSIDPEPAGRGPIARVAAWLVGGLLASTPLLPTAVLAEERPRIAVVLSETRAMESLVTAGPGLSPAPPAEASATEPAASYVVRTWDEHRDCLWNIAERYLGDPLRWGELLELNAEAAQPSGRHLTDDPQHWIYPGMVVRLPADAMGTDLRPARPESSPEALAVPPPPAPSPGPVASAPGPAGSPIADSVAATPPPPTSPPTSSTAIAPPAVPKPGPVPAAEAPATPAAPAPPSGGSPAPVRLDRGAMLAAAAALGLPVLAAGGIALRLNRRRHVQVARHRPGRDIVRPDPDLEPLERRLRAIASDEATEWVDAGLRALGAALAESSLPAPPVTCVRAGELGLEILLAEPAAEVPSGFTVDDGGAVWRLDPGLELVDVQARGADHVATLPALISLGASPEGPLLVDLEAVGTLSVEGDDARVGAFLAGVAVQLASAPWAEGIDLRVRGGPPALSGVEGVTVVEDLHGLFEELATTAASNREALGPRPSTMAARVDEAGEQWPPTVVVVAEAGHPGDVAEVAAVAAAGSGVALAAPGPIEGAAWRLLIVSDGFARLEPLGLDVCAAVDEDAIAGAASLLSSASHDDDIAPVVELSADGARETGPPSHHRHDVWVDVLGPVEITGWAEPIGQRRKLEELVAYLATHSDRPVSGERIRCAVWPDNDELSSKGFVQAISRTRRHLGGRSLFPEASNGSYRLGPGVGCSWALFKELAAAAGRAGPSEAISLWRQALGLVRGEPFADVAKGTYVWAWSEQLVYEMQVAITRAVNALASLALAADDPDTASWATRQGLLAVPSQLSLFDWEVRVAAHRRDIDGLNAAFHARRRAEQALDPLSDVPRATVDLYEHLLADLQGQRRSQVGS